MFKRKCYYVFATVKNAKLAESLGTNWPWSVYMDGDKKLFVFKIKKWSLIPAPISKFCNNLIAFGIKILDKLYSIFFKGYVWE